EASPWRARATFHGPRDSGQTILGQSRLPSARSVPPPGLGAALDASGTHKAERSKARASRPGVSFGVLVACDPQSRSVRIRPRPPGFAPGDGPGGSAPEADRGTLPDTQRVQILPTAPFDGRSSGPADPDWRTRRGPGWPL